MKSIINITLVSLCLFAVASCDRNPVEGGRDIKQMVTLYTDGEASNKAQMYNPQEIKVQDEEPIEVEKVLSVGLNSMEENDKTLNLEISNQAASVYMDRTKTKYELFPASLVDIPKSIVVSKGSMKSVAIPFKVKIDNTVKFNVPYIFAVRLNGHDGEVVEANRVAIYTVIRTVGDVKINKAVHLYRTNYFKLTKPFPYDLPNGMTIECFINPQQFRNAKDEGEAQISTLCGIEGSCLFRFGDAGIPGNYLQCYGAKLDMPFETNKWYHFAASISADGNMKIYINGKEMMNITGKRPMLSSMQWFIGRSYSGGRGINALLSEFRIWNKVRTQSQIQDAMFAVDPTTDGLLAYWKMDKAGAGPELVEDATGHGHNLFLMTNVASADTPDKQGRPADKAVVVDELKKPISID